MDESQTRRIGVARARSRRFAIGALMVLLCGGATSTCWAQDEFDLEIRTDSTAKTPILVRDFTYDGPPRKLLARGEAPEEIVVQDLEFSDYFDVSREGGRVSSQSHDAVVWGRVVERFGKVVLQGQIIDAENGDLIYQNDYPLGDPPDRWALHAFSDDVVLYLTGEKGVSSTRIAFVGTATGSKEIYLIDYDGARLSRLTTLGSISLSPAWSPNGKSIAFMTYASGNPDLVIMDVGGSDVRALSRRQGLNSAPAYHPKGNKVIATLSFEGNSELYTMNAEGGELRRITFDTNSIETSAAYSPTGDQIAFISDRTGQPQVYVMDQDGSNVRRISHLNGFCDSPDWSPNGEWISFVARIDGVFDVFIVRPDGSGGKRLTANEGNHENPAWAPDSRHLVYAKTYGGERRLFVMAANGQGKRQLTWSQGDQYNPAWSPSLKQ
ncbi:MAG: PD40 domain-containing protein [Candidatus Eisenbacteria bacterium]|uniref:PD40 domain-containing protein n=1 Tax=Eiseniibacteriota bacterium TaxID=2212470 RepID=A0A956N8W2_UNCEI|nr:PD40 domain-containing protein [Candidatus Eisenbacteria bacterium]MCB9463203.1 PD40 domain-containing protein [Candidatus Eisenbacteria bacterium]